MFAVSGPGILILSIFAVPSCALLFVLWKPKNQQSEARVPASDAAPQLSGGSLSQVRNADQEQLSIEPILTPPIEVRLPQGSDATPALEDLQDVSLISGNPQVDELSEAASIVVALGLSGELQSFEQSLTEFSQGSNEQSALLQTVVDHDSEVQEPTGGEGLVEQTLEELSPVIDLDSGADSPPIASQHPIPPMPPTGPSVNMTAKALRVKKVRNKMATFPFDVSVWDDPLSPRAMRRKQRKAERLEAGSDAKRVRSNGSKDVPGTNTAPVALHYDLGVEPLKNDVFLDVWAQASGAAAPDEVGQLVTARGESRGRRKAEKESRSLERMTKKRKQKEERAAQKKGKGDSTGMGAPAFSAEAGDGIGDAAVLAGAEIVEGEGVTFVGDGLETTEIEVGTWDVDFDEEDGDAGSAPQSQRGVKRAERESRALEKLTAKRRKAAEKAGSSSTGVPSIEGFPEDFTGVGENAVIAVGAVETDGVSAWELAAQAETVDPNQEPAALTWESAAGSAEQGMGVEAVSAWDQAAETASLQGSIVEFSPQAITSSSDLLEMGAAVVIGEGPGQGGDAWFVPEGFDEYEEEPRRRAGRRRKRRDDDGEIEEAVGGGWTDGGVLVEADENIDFRAYDLPEPVPARASVMFGESE